MLRKLRVDKMYKTHKIRLNLTKQQEQHFWKAAGIARFVFNYGLERWKKQYNESLINHDTKKPSEFVLKKKFNAIKREQFPFVLDVSKSVSEGAFKDLGRAFANFFRRVKRGDAKVGYPHFKSRKRTKPAFYLANDRFDITGHCLKIQKCSGIINMAEELRFEGKIISGRVSRDCLHWYIAIGVEIEPPNHIHQKESVGIDLGIKTLVTLSDDGLQYENQRLYKSELSKLKCLSRKAARRKIGSNRREKARLELAKLHLKIANRRNDYIHKMTTEIARIYRIIGIEDLNVAGMVKNHNLAQALSDASFAEIRRQLEYKAQWFNGLVVPIYRFFPSSKLCSVCGAIKAELTLDNRVYVCGCGNVMDRDWNAATNINAEALRIVAGMAISTLKMDVEMNVRPNSRQLSVKRQLNNGVHNYTPER